jgi:uncharacterized membrane protein
MAVKSSGVLMRLPTRARFAATYGVGVIGLLATGLSASWLYAPLVGWDASALVFIVTIWLTVAPMGAVPTAAHTAREDPGRAVSDVFTLVAAVASLAAVALILIRSGDTNRTERNLIAAFALASVALSWFALHTLFTLRYARLYYSTPLGGIDFNQDEQPSYLDFAYVAFTIGMCFQVSDTTLRSSVIRATSLRHALLSYLFGAVILAAAINVVVGITSG